MYQNGSAAYDGSVGITQCPIYPDDEFTYLFEANPAGTFWYHSHVKGQFPDGQRGMMIVHDPEWEDNLDVAEQVYFSFSDW
jgi:iron transport multicopper oxidase